MSTIRLLPCPFCGGEPTIRPWHGGRPTKKTIFCSNGHYYDEDGGCSVGPSVCGETEEEAAAAWNRRTANEEKLTPEDRTFARIEFVGDDGSSTMSEIDLSDIAMRAAQKLSHPGKFGDAA